MPINVLINNGFKITVELAFTVYNALAPYQQCLFMRLILNSLNKSTHSYIQEHHCKTEFVCPYCGSKHVVRNGKDTKENQRYKCKDCNKRFCDTTNTITYHSKRSIDKWQAFIECLLYGWPLRICAEECKISIRTAFVWRHKILDLIRSLLENQTLSGIIEADETHFSVSFKGNHSKGDFCMPRQPHKRGNDIHKRGLSSEKVCVPCAVSANGNLAISGIGNLAKVQTSGLQKVLSNHLEQGSTLVTDEATAYRKFSSGNKLTLVQLKNGGFKLSSGLTLQHINSYHSDLKHFLYTFRGVSTKYLNNYLTWFNYLRYKVKNRWLLFTELLCTVLTTPFYERNSDINKREPVPV